MEIKIVNNQAASLHEAFGITEERSNQLCDLMTWYSTESGVRLSELIESIAFHCKTIEELAFICITHGRYLEIQGKFDNIKKILKREI